MHQCAPSPSRIISQVVGTGMRGYIESSYSMESVTGIFAGSLVGLVFCAIVQLSFLHRTLANSPVSYGVPNPSPHPHPHPHPNPNPDPYPYPNPNPNPNPDPNPKPNPNLNPEP